jgi:hypothetical protein
LSEAAESRGANSFPASEIGVSKGIFYRAKSRESERAFKPGHDLILGKTEVLRCDRFNRFGNRKRYFVLQNARKYLEIHACSAETLVIFRC